MMFRKILVAFVLLALLGGCKSELMSNLSEAEANEMIVGLYRNNITAEKKLQSDGRFMVRVEDADKATAMAILQNYGLPRPSRKSCDQLSRKGGGFISSKVEDLENKRCNMKLGIEQQYLALPGVIDANVELVLPEYNPLSDVPNGSAASVVLTYQYNADTHPRNEIKKIIVHAVPDLRYENISVHYARGGSVLEKSTDIAEVEELRRQDAEGGFGGRSGSLIVYSVVGLLILMSLLAAFLYRRGVKEREAQYRELLDDEAKSPLPRDEAGPTLGGSLSGTPEIDDATDASYRPGLESDRNDDSRRQSTSLERVVRS